VRAFVAIDIDEPIRDALVRTTGRLPAAGVRWVRDHHVTLKFLGEVSDEQASRLRDLLRAHRQAPMEIEIRGLGHFDRRVIWAGCRGDLAALSRLAGAVDKAAAAVQVEPERFPYSPHITIGRAKSPKGARELCARLPPDEPFGSLSVRSFVLYKSTLTPKGPIYEGVERFALHS